MKDLILGILALAFIVCGIVVLFFGPVIVAIILKDPQWILSYMISWIPGMGLFLLGRVCAELA